MKTITIKIKDKYLQSILKGLNNHLNSARAGAMLMMKNAKEFDELLWEKIYEEYSETKDMSPTYNSEKNIITYRK